MNARPRLVVAVLVLAFTSGACGKDDHNLLKPQPFVYPQLINPYSVLDALRLAYARRDTVEIKRIYDDSYQGTSLDQRDPSPTLLTFLKSDEVQHVSALAHDNSLLHVALNLEPILQRFTDAGDPPGWATIADPVSSVEVSDALTSRMVLGANNVMEFKFVPHTPDASSATDTTWKIVRWTEVQN